MENYAPTGRMSTAKQDGFKCKAGYGCACNLSIHKTGCAPPTLALKNALVEVGKRGCVFVQLWKLSC